jgi:hypothetical protein
MRLLDLILIKDLPLRSNFSFILKLFIQKHTLMKQFFLFLLLSATTFAVAQEDLSVTLIDFNTKPIPNLRFY